MENLDATVPLKEHRGKYTEEEVIKVLDNTRYTESSKRMIINYLVNGKRIKDIKDEENKSKQYVFNRVKKAVDLYYS